MRTFIILVLVVLNAHFSFAEDSHFGQWAAIFMQGKANERVGWFFESQTRLSQSELQSNSTLSRSGKGNRVLWRGAVRFLFPDIPGLQLHFGYGWTPQFSPFRDEGRLYQQAQYSHSVPGGLGLLRLRTEQRFIERASGTSHRLRIMARYQGDQLKVSESLTPVVWDEYFYNFNRIDAGPSSGFDQNRLFAGFRVPFADSTHFEFGYMNVQTSGIGPEVNLLTSHILSLSFFVDL